MRTRRQQISTKIFSELPGNWGFQRFKNDEEVAVGQASFQSRINDSLHYREKGRLYLSCHSYLEFIREYIYLPTDNGINIYFFNNSQIGKKFLSLNFIANIATGSHKCDKDIYNAYFEFYCPNKFKVEYLVTGPVKDYTLTTFYKKLSRE